MGYTQRIKEILKKRCPLLIKIKRHISNAKYVYHCSMIQKKYNEKLHRITYKARADGKVKVAFIIVFNSVFQYGMVFEAMLKDEKFDPYIIVAPNISRTHEYQMDVYNEAMDALSIQYPERVIGGYNEVKNEFLELGEKFSIVFFCNPYPNLVHRYHYLDYFLDKDVLTIYQNYGFAALGFWNNVVTSDFYNKVWMTCIETKTNMAYLREHQQIRGRNAVVTGFLKMDKLAHIVLEPRERKRIIICPHHTVWGWKTLDIGNFLKYYGLFKRLPALYPDIDFVFRPHPLLFPNLLSHKLWTQEMIDEYICDIDSLPNAVYDHSGDYLDQFINSDAMIHDCGSFIGEYLYTEKPCCYMLKNQEQILDGLVPLGKMCLEHYYKAFSEKDIIEFIDNVVIEGNDPMKQKREQFVKNELKVAFPHAADSLVELLKGNIFGC